MSARSARWLVPRIAVVIGLTAVVSLLGAAPVPAHPYGPPPTAVIAVEGSEVTIEWQAELDDTVALVVSLGLLHATATDWDWSTMNTADRTAIGQALGEARTLHAYVLENIQVRQGGVVCEGDVAAAEDFLGSGARVLYTCAHDVEALSVRITMLHGLHEAYRTFAQARGEARPLQHVFTSAESEHRWEFAASGTGSTAPDSPWRERWAATLAALLVAGAVGVTVQQRRRSKLRRG